MPPHTLRLLCLVGCLLIALITTSVSAELRYQIPSKVSDVALYPKLLRFWEPTVLMLMEVIDNAKFRTAMRTALEAARSTRGVIDVCSSHLISCANGDELAVEALTITGLHEGVLRLSSLPATVTRISIVDGILAQPFALADVPASVRVFESVRTQWTSVTELAFTARGDGAGRWAPAAPALSVLRFVGSSITRVRVGGGDCGEAGCVVRYAPSLTELDLSHSAKLVELDVSALPVTLTALRLRNVPSWKPPAGTSVGGILRRFRSLKTLLLDPVRVRFSLHDLAHIPDTMRVLQLEHAPVSVGVEQGERNVAQLRDVLASGVTNSLQELSLTNCGLTGTLPDLTLLGSLESLDLSGNAIVVAAFSHLPLALRSLNLSRNGMEADLPPLVELPARLLRLDLSHNKLTGSVDLRVIPTSIEHIDLSHNALSGPVDTTVLSENVRKVFLQANRFTGEVKLIDLPLLLQHILVHDNSWDPRLPAK